MSLAVHVDLDGQPLPAGTAYVTERRGTVSTMFTYAEEFLAHRGAYSISPELPVDAARHHTQGLA